MEIKGGGVFALRDGVEYPVDRDASGRSWVLLGPRGDSPGPGWIADGDAWDLPVTADMVDEVYAFHYRGVYRVSR